MKLVGYDGNTRSLTDRTFWWKAHNEHVIKEIGHLRGHVSIGMKSSINEGEYLIKHIIFKMLL